MRTREVKLEELDGFDPNEVITEEDARWYPHNDELYVPSVTTYLDQIINRDLAIWRDLVGKEAADKIANLAAREGSMVHDACEDISLQLMNNGEAVYSWLDQYGNKKFNSLVWSGVMRFVDFVDKHVDEFLFVEERLTSQTLFVGGRNDAVIKLNDGRVGIVDYKFSNALSSKYSVQTYVYKKLIEEIHGLEIDFRANLWLKAKTRGEDKSGKAIQGKGWKLVEHTDDEEDRLTFEAAQFLFMREYKKGKLKPEIRTYPVNLIIKK